MDEWTEEIVDILERIRQNSVHLAESHRKKYHELSSWAKWFRVPTLTMGILSSTLSSQPFGASKQQSETGILILGCCISILSAVELYLNINGAMDLENKMAKDFYNVAVDIYKMLRLHPEERSEKARDFLNKKFAEYVKLKESSPLNGKLKHDLLAKLPNMKDDELMEQGDLYKSVAMTPSFLFEQIKKSSPKLNESEREGTGFSDTP